MAAERYAPGMEWTSDPDHVSYHRWIGGARDLDPYDRQFRDPTVRDNLENKGFAGVPDPEGEPVSMHVQHVFYV